MTSIHFNFLLRWRIPFFFGAVSFSGGVSILRRIDWRLNNVTFQCSQVWKFILNSRYASLGSSHTLSVVNTSCCVSLKRGWEKHQPPGRICHFGWKFGLLNTHIIWNQFGIPIGVPSLSTWKQLRFQLAGETRWTLKCWLWQKIQCLGWSQPRVPVANEGLVRDSLLKTS